jgi:hypothetical protein
MKLPPMFSVRAMYKFSALKFTGTANAELRAKLSAKPVSRHIAKPVQAVLLSALPFSVYDICEKL